MNWFVRIARLLVSLALVAALAAGTAASAASAAAAVAAQTAGGSSVTVSPRVAAIGRPVVVRLTLPAETAAVDGRLLFDADAADFVGIAPLGGGTALYPEPISGGIAFGAYDLRAPRDRTVLRFIFAPRIAGGLHVQVLVDATANAAGRRLGTWSGPARERVDQPDLGAARGAWAAAALRGSLGDCQATLPGDANADGCVDIVDVQATLASMGSQPRAKAAAPLARRPSTGVVYAHTWTVDSTADTADADPHDDICADADNHCTLRAAITESNYEAGNDLIAFNLAGPAPVTIQLGSDLPFITALNGTVTIDGYTQPTSSVSSATVGSNAVPGVELRGNGADVDDVANRQIALYITSPGNTVRGLVIDKVFRAIMLDGTDAHDNRILGNWLGYTRTGGTPASTGTHGILMNTGANHNVVGTPDLADRNVIGNWTKAIDSYGPGTDFNTIQNNLFCIGPTGFTKATCSTGVDHDFGPKHELLGGTEPNTRNVFGPTNAQGIEYSHGWNRNDDTDTSDTWQVNDNQAIGNWVGFRGDGSYLHKFRSGLLKSSSDNGEGINVYDGSNRTVIQGNYVASVYNGIQVQSPNSASNVIRGNVIGVSPTGQAAPLTGWGIVVRWATTLDVIEGNTIRNAAAGGIGLLNVSNSGAAQPVATNIRITQNIVTDTNGRAIFLAKSQSDPTTGANTLLKSPVITYAAGLLVKGTGIAGATVEVYRASLGAGKSGLPRHYIGSATVRASGKWKLVLAAAEAPHRVTALQIAPDQNTSALGVNVQVAP